MAKKRKLGDISQSSELLIEPIWDQKHFKKTDCLMYTLIWKDMPW